MAIEDDVRDILEEVPAGLAFDSHFVIEQLRRNDKYIDATASFAGGRETTLPAHGNIGRVVAAFADRGELIERIRDREGNPVEAQSLNIHGNPSKCGLWLRARGN